MDSYHQYGNHTNNDKNAQNASRVYVNPNFQHSSTFIPLNGRNTLVPQTGRKTQVPQVSMYLNPQFHKNTYQNFQPPNTNKPKIYVNPNFVRASPVAISNHYTTHVAYSIKNSYYETTNAPISNARTSTPMMSSYHSSTYTSTQNTYYVNSKNCTVTSSTDSLQLPNVTPRVMPQQPFAVAKSRYSLVRQNNNAIPDVGINNTDVITKMKISKFKTVSLDHVRKMQIQKEKPVPAAFLQTNRPIVAEKSRRIARVDFTKSRFKYIKTNTNTKAVKVEFKTPIKRRSLDSSKIMLGSSQKLKMRVDVRKFKKNNIPCPLFKKYGMCLRNSKGKCEFIHDKKHVSICRKFLKGVCHDKNCLLSHEISAEKMPTCSFYLNGMCTREDCPYLHVKLNEKTKICLDFLKGYCENGNKCLNRHVNICPDQAMKGSCLRKKCPYPHRNNKKILTINKVNTRIFNHNIKSKIYKKIDKTENINENSSNHSSDKVEENKDCRYYKEVEEDNSSVEVEVIKPSRCKLGALPSFIQL